MKKIVITGPESTGKSTLARHLADRFDGIYIPEYARKYIDRLRRPYNYDDILIIAKNQIDREDNIDSNKNDLAFLDTDLIVCKIWSKYVFKKCDPWIEAQIIERPYDYYLLQYIDLPWIADSQREHPDKRKEIFDLYVNELRKLNKPFSVVKGSGEERLANAIRILQTEMLI